MPARLAPFRAAALRHLVLPAVLCTAPHALGAQAPSAAAAPAAVAPRVTRADLAAAYQRVDAWVIAHPLDSATAVYANRLFDQSTLQFFAGRGAEAVRALNRLAAGLQGDTTADGDLVRTLGLRLDASPAVYVRNAGAPSLALAPVVPVAGATPLRVAVRLLDARDRAVHREDVVLDPGQITPRPLVIPSATLDRLAPGRYRLVTRPRGAAGDLVLGTWDVARESPDTLRQRLAARLAGVDTTTHPQAVAALRARLGNLVGTPNVEQSAQFLSDPASLGAALGREVDAIAAGRDPYAPSDARDLWRTIVGPGGRALPVRVIVPAGDRRVPRPLVIALHGAGGDENMFPDAYGAGEVVRQAAARGAIVVSPATTVFQRDVAMLDSVLAVMRRSHVIDTSRVYLLGHSMGAAATYAAAAARADRIAASVLLNGAGRAPSPGTRVPPSLWIAGALDPVIPVSRTRPAAEAAVAAGAAVTYREHPTAGHTLGVGPMLAEAFEFLFAHRLGTP